MPKKPQRPEAEVHAMIVTDAKMRLGCADFAPDFTLGKAHGQPANWEVAAMRDAASWPSDCAQAFQEAVARARRKFDIAWHASLT